jgi:hypothetical protein
LLCVIITYKAAKLPNGSSKNFFEEDIAAIWAPRVERLTICRVVLLCGIAFGKEVGRRFLGV